MYRFALQRRTALTLILARLLQTSDQFHRTIFPTPQRVTFAHIVPDLVMALSIHARMVPFTFIDFRLAQFTLVAVVTIASKLPNTVHTTPILARIVFAFVDIYFASLANDTRHTDALESGGILVAEWLGKYRREFGESFRQRVQRSIRSFQALAIVQTRRTLTLVNVAFAILSLVSVVALTLIIVHQVQTHCPIFARHGDAFVDVHFAIVAGETGTRAVACEATKFVFAVAFVLARLRCTVVDVDVAGGASHSWYAHACERGDLIDTGGSFEARIRGTFVDVMAAIFPTETRRADALIVVYLVIRMRVSKVNCRMEWFEFVFKII